MYFRDADGAILVFDVTSKDSFESISKVWLKEVREKAPQNIQIAIVGNKSDLTGPLSEKEEKRRKSSSTSQD